MLCSFPRMKILQKSCIYGSIYHSISFNISLELLYFQAFNYDYVLTNNDIYYCKLEVLQELT